MNKKELISEVAKAVDEPKKTVEKVFNQIFETLKNAMAEKKRVSIKGFGTFGTKERKEKVGRHPRTGEEIKIEARTVPVFKPGSQLKELVASGKKAKSAKSSKKKASSAKKTTSKKKASKKKSSTKKGKKKK